MQVQLARMENPFRWNEETVPTLKLSTPAFIQGTTPPAPWLWHSFFGEVEYVLTLANSPYK